MTYDPVYHKAYRAANRPRQKFLEQRWRAENGDRRKKVDAAWREANREHIREKHRAWSAANPDKWRDNLARQRARRAAVPVIDRINRRDVWQRDGGVCGLCHEPADPARWHLDHIIPIKRGGTHTMANVQVAHPSCNQRKGAR